MKKISRRQALVLTAAGFAGCRTGIEVKQPRQFPYTRQRGSGCVQAQLHMVLSYFHPKRNWDLVDLDRRTGRSAGQWTWLAQIMPVLEQEGIEAKLFSTLNYPVLQRENLRSIYSEKTAKLLEEVTNWEALHKATEHLIHAKRFEHRRLTLSDLENACSKGHVVILIVDASIIKKQRHASFQGHTVTITATDEKYIHYHDSAQGPNQRCPRKQFEK